MRAWLLLLLAVLPLSFSVTFIVDERHPIENALAQAEAVMFDEVVIKIAAGHYVVSVPVELFADVFLEGVGDDKTTLEFKAESASMSAFNSMGRIMFQSMTFRMSCPTAVPVIYVDNGCPEFKDSTVDMAGANGPVFEVVGGGAVFNNVKVVNLTQPLLSLSGLNQFSGFLTVNDLDIEATSVSKPLFDVSNTNVDVSRVTLNTTSVGDHAALFDFDTVTGTITDIKSLSKTPFPTLHGYIDDITMTNLDLTNGGIDVIRGDLTVQNAKIVTTSPSAVIVKETKLKMTNSGLSSSDVCLSLQQEASADIEADLAHCQLGVSADNSEAKLKVTLLDVQTECEASHGGSCTDV